MPWLMPIIGSLTLGLAPFTPQPHLFEKLQMLANGELTKTVDIFDMLMHGAFPLLLLVKVVIHFIPVKEVSE